jgi:hypothetical protein
MSVAYGGGVASAAHVQALASLRRGALQAVVVATAVSEERLAPAQAPGATGPRSEIHEEDK